MRLNREMSQEDGIPEMDVECDDYEQKKTRIERKTAPLKETPRNHNVSNNLRTGSTIRGMKTKKMSKNFKAKHEVSQEIKQNLERANTSPYKQGGFNTRNNHSKDFMNSSHAVIPAVDRK